MEYFSFCFLYNSLATSLRFSNIKSGFTSEFSTSSSLVSPDRTNKLVAPWLYAVAISVYSLSPTTRYHQALNLFDPKYYQRFLYLVSKIFRFLSVDAVINAHIAPQSGINPSSVGQLKSGWVAIKSLPFLMRVQAIDSFS